MHGKQESSDKTMDTSNTYLGEFEELVLMAINSLGDNAYGVTIRQKLEKAAGRTISYGALYSTLDRLERKQFVSSSQGGATPTRGGRAKRFFRVEALGEQVLANARKARENLLFTRLDPATEF